MKIIFEKNILLSAIQPAMSCVSNVNTIPTIKGINLNCNEEGKCIVTSYDLEKGFRCEIPCETQKPGNYIINADTLIKIVNAMPSGYITFEVDANNVTRISSGKSEFEIYAMNGEDFPQLPVLTGDKGFSIAKGVLKDMIQKTKFAVAQNDMRPELNGAFFKIEGSKITVVSCDGSKMAIREQNTDIKRNEEEESAFDMKFIIPGKTLDKLTSFLNDSDEEILIRLTRKYVIFRFETMVFFSRLIENEYIDYSRFLPKSSKTTVNIDCEAFLGALERALLVTEDKTMGQSKSILRCNFEDNMLKISSVSASRKIYDEIITSKEGEDIVIGFNCSYLLAALRSADSEKLKLSLSSALTGMTIEPAEAEEGSGFIFLVLPVKIKE